MAGAHAPGAGLQESWACSAWRRDGFGGTSQSPGHLWGEDGEDGARLFVEVRGSRTKDNFQATEF